MRFLIATLVIVIGFWVIAQEKPGEEFITIDVRDKSFAEVIENIKAKTGQKILYDEDIQDTFITIKLVHVPWLTAIKLLAEETNCEVEETEKGVYKVYRPPTITMEFEAADVKDVIHQMVIIANKNILIPEGLKGKISLRLKNVTWQDAMETILKTCGYMLCKEENGIFKIVPTSKSEPEKTEDKSVQKVTDESSQKAVTDASSQKNEPAITIDVHEKPFGEIIEGIKTQTGKNILYDAELNDILVTARLHDVLWLLALLIIAKDKNCQVAEIAKDVFKVSKIPTVTMEFEDADIRDVVHYIAAVANENIIIPEDLQGKISPCMKNVPWQDAMESILKAQGYILCREENGIFRVLPVPKPVKMREEDKHKAIQKALAELLEKMPNKTGIPVSKQPKAISLDIQNQTLDKVIEQIKKDTGANIVYDEEVGRIPVTIQLSDLPYQKALSVIAKKYGVMEEYDYENDVYKLRSPSTAVIEFEGADIKDVLSRFAMIGNFNLVLSEKIRGNVSLSLRNIPFREAIEDVANECGYLLFQEKEGRILRVVLPSDWEIAESDGSILNLASPAIIVPLLVLLQDSDASVRARAAGALGQICDKTAIPGLVAAIQDPDYGVRYAAIKALGKIGKKSDEAISHLKNALKDKELYTKYAASEILARMGERMVPMLVDMSKDPDKDVIYQAAATLGKIVGKKLTVRPPSDNSASFTLNGIIYCAGNPRKSVAFMNNKFFYKDDVFNPSTDGKNDAKSSMIVHEIKEREIILIRYGEEKTSLGLRKYEMKPVEIAESAIPVLEELLKHPDAGVRIYAVWTLGNMGTKVSSVVPSMEKLLHDPDEEVTAQVKKAIQKIKK